MIQTCSWTIVLFLSMAVWSPMLFGFAAMVQEEGKADDQEVLSFEVFVRDHTGAPVKGAEVKPWAPDRILSETC